MEVEVRLISYTGIHGIVEYNHIRYSIELSWLRSHVVDDVYTIYDSFLNPKNIVTGK